MIALRAANSPFEVGIAGRLRQVDDDVVADLVGRVEAERREVADVELDDAVALLLHQLRPGEHRPPDVVADVGELRRLADRLQHDDEQPPHPRGA